MITASGSSKILSRLNIQPGEGQLVVLMFTYTALLGFVIVFVRTAAFALFLAKFGSAWLPYVYMGSGVGVAAVSFVYFRLGQRLPLPRLLYANLGILLASLVGLRLALAWTGAAWLIFLLPVCFDMVMLLTTLAVWPLAGRLFDVQQAKRLFGLIGTGNSVAVGLGGILVPGLVSLVGTANLVTAGAIGVVAAGGMLAYILRISARQPDFVVKPARRARTEAPGRLVRERYIGLMILLMLLFWLAYLFIDNIFYISTRARYPDQDQLASFLGLFAGVVGVFTVVSRARLTGPILKRFGVRTGLMMMPIALLGGAGLVLAGGLAGLPVEGVFWLVVLLKGTDVVTRFSIGQSAQLILYQPLSATRQVQVQTLVESVYPVAFGLGGLVLLGLNQAGLIYVLAALLLVWIGVAVLIGREYPGMLQKALGKRILGSETVPILVNADEVRLLEQALRQPSPATALYALRLLRETAPAAVIPHIPALLSHPAVEVQREVLRYIEDFKVADGLDLVRVMAGQPGSFQIQAVRVLAILGEPVGLAPYLRLADSAGAADRAQAARFAGELGRYCDLEHLVERLLGDPSPQVRRAAALAVAQAGYRRQWVSVVTLLDAVETQAAAMQALVAGGDEAMPVIQKMFTAGQNRFTLMRLIYVCGQIGSPAALALLIACLDWPDEGVRGRAYRMLAQNNFQAVEAGLRARIEAQIEVELAQFTVYLASLLQFQRKIPPVNALLFNALSRQLDETRGRIFRLLFFCYGPAIRQVRAGLESGVGKQRAAAVELFEVLLPAGALKRKVRPLLVENDPARQLENLGEYFSTKPAGLIDLITGRHWWLRVCAIYAVGLAPQNPAAELVEAIVPHLTSPYELIRDTTFWAVARINDTSYRSRENQMISVVQKALILKSTQFFAGLPDESLSEVAHHAEVVMIRAGEMIFEAGEFGDCMYVLVEGGVDIRGEQGHNGTNIQPGQVFGELAMIGSQNRLAAAVAAADGLLLRIGREVVFELINHPAAAVSVIQTMAVRLRQYQVE